MLRSLLKAVKFTNTSIVCSIQIKTVKTLINHYSDESRMLRFRYQTLPVNSFKLHILIHHHSKFSRLSVLRNEQEVASLNEILLGL